MKVSGTIRVPGDKSISHRALMLSALADGTSSVRGILRSADVESTASVLRALGVSVPALGDEMRIDGVGFSGMRAPATDLDCGNSGTTTRLMTGIVAGQEIRARFVGDSSLSRRPMKRISEPLTQMGARFEFDNGDGLPMTVTGGHLEPIDWDTKAASAQTKSAILLAALVAGVEAKVRETVRSRDHTERMLSALGTELRVSDRMVHLPATTRIKSLSVTVPGDPSSAAFFVALATLADEGELSLPGVCVNATRGGFVAALARMGASIELTDPSSECGEDIATLRVQPSTLHPLQITAADVPSLIDELPMLACLAAAGGVELEIHGAAELRVKETDRIRAIVQNLKCVGAHAEELPDGFVVRQGRRKFAGEVVTHGDHRIAMAFAVIGKLPGNDIRIDNRDCVGVSYPAFWNDLERAVA